MAKTRRRAYPSAESKTQLREGREYGKRGNAKPVKKAEKNKLGRGN